MTVVRAHSSSVTRSLIVRVAHTLRSRGHRTVGYFPADHLLEARCVWALMAGGFWAPGFYTFYSDLHVIIGM